MSLARWSYLSLVTLLALSQNFLFAWENPSPAASKDTAFYSGTLRGQVRYKDWLPMLETNYRIEGADQGNPRAAGTNTTGVGTATYVQQPWYLMLGSYYNIFNFLMVGGFYRYGQGERHRNDWIANGWGAVGTSTTWDWFWANANGRSEQSAIGDVTLRQKIPFLPEGLVFELKNRIMYTWYSDDRYTYRDNWGASTGNIAETKYIVRPGIQYFWMDGDRPFMTFFLQYEAHFALNFGSRNLVESWGYLGLLYNLSDEVAIGLNVARAQWWWTTSNSTSAVRAVESCAVSPGSAATAPCNQVNYTATQLAWVYGVTAMVRLDLTPIE